MRKLLLLFYLAIVVTGCSTIENESQATEIVVVETAETKTETVKPSPIPGAIEGQPPVEESLNHLDFLNRLLFSTSTRAEGQAILAKIEASKDTRFVAGLIDTMRYQRSLRTEIGDTLNGLTGQDLPPDWFEWVEWAGKHPEIESFDGYVGFKANLFAQIDPNFLRFVHEDMKVAPDSRPEEIVWGGVLVDGGHGARAYERGEHIFTSAADDTTIVLLDEEGNEWQVTENALISNSGEELTRRPGHMAYWFGWFSFYPQTELYTDEE
jgi:hypothetical protein